VKGTRHLVILVEGKTFLVLYLIPLDGLGIPLEGRLEPIKVWKAVPVKNYYDCMLKCSPRSPRRFFFRDCHSMEGDLAFFIHFHIVTVDRFVEGLLRSLLSKLAQH